MPRAPSDYARRELRAEGARLLSITDGEINFLWSFIQGSIMNPDTWRRLLDAYGFCERHAWVHISIETTFRDQYLLGPTILYQALIEKALYALHTPRISKHSIVRKLRATDTCLLCALRIADASPGASPQVRLDRGRESWALQSFASALEPLWGPYVCNVCKGDEPDRKYSSRCRPHVLADVRRLKLSDLSGQNDMLEELHDRVTRYQQSFTAGGLKASDQDRAALLTAIGWCTGWGPLLTLLNQQDEFGPGPINRPSD
jgi:hypothetical protein